MNNNQMAKREVVKVKCKFIGHRDGYGFAKPLDLAAEIPDFFIPPNCVHGAINNDIVLVKSKKDASKEFSSEGEICEIVERGNAFIVGVISYFQGKTFVEPDDKKFGKKFEVEKNGVVCEAGDRVVATLVYSEDKSANPTGILSENLGKFDDIESIQMGIVREHNLFESFPQKVIDESLSLSAEIPEEQRKRRRELEGLKIFTIDGADAKDLDDAISIETLEGGIKRLGVHIADVGHYVPKGSEIDKEAFLRGTSVYFPNFVLPMLPVALSNNLCSLNPKTDKLALSVFMNIDENGNVVDYEIEETIINSCARLTYDEVFAVIQGDESACEKLAFIKEDILQMNKLAKILEQKRKERGALDFEIAEPFFVICEQTNDVVDILKRERNDAHKMIESFMIICNEVVAKHFCKMEYPFIYRVHEEPSREKVLELVEFVKSLGYKISNVPSKITPEFLDELMKVSDDEIIKESINKNILRSMKKAKYFEKCLGHYGLASEFYTHFTSPIRRYSDLSIHRIIKESAKEKLTRDELENLNEFVHDAAYRASETEKNADDAERDVDDLRKAQYIKKFIGQEFDGAVSGITPNGIYVELENSCEGLVRIFNANKFKSGQKGKKFGEKTVVKSPYKLGDKLRIKVVKVDLQERKVDFAKVNKLIGGANLNKPKKIFEKSKIGGIINK